MNRFIHGLALAIGMVVCYNSALAAVPNVSTESITKPNHIVPECFDIEDFIPHYYLGHKAIVHGYFDLDAAAIITALTDRLGPAPTRTGEPPTDVYFGMDLDDGLTDFLLADQEGCYVGAAEGTPLEYAREIFESAAVDPPF